METTAEKMKRLGKKSWDWLSKPSDTVPLSWRCSYLP